MLRPGDAPASRGPVASCAGCWASYFAVQSRGVYFAMLTFAFAQLLYELAVKWVEVTGGTDGLPGVGRPRLGLGQWTLELSVRQHMYYLVVVCVALGYLVARRIVGSPFGRALVAIREK